MKKPFSGLLSPDPFAKYAPAEPSPKEILVALYGLLMRSFLIGLFTALGALAAIWLIGGIQLRWNDESGTTPSANVVRGTHCCPNQ